MIDMPEVRTVVIERTLAHPPEKIWRALTQPHLIGEWLMQTDFQPVKARHSPCVGNQGPTSMSWSIAGCAT